MDVFLTNITTDAIACNIRLHKVFLSCCFLIAGVSQCFVSSEQSRLLPALPEVHKTFWFFSVTEGKARRVIGFLDLSPIFTIGQLKHTK